MDHRWGNRIPTDVEVRLACGTRRGGRGRLENVSMTGAFIRTAVRPPLLSQVLVITHADTDEGRKRYEATACVVRDAADGIGVEWIDLDPAMLPVILAAGQIAAGYAQDSPTHALIGSRR
jgi:PilZ domain-containing protein